jgi:hypothetical protein
MCKSGVGKIHFITYLFIACKLRNLALQRLGGGKEKKSDYMTETVCHLQNP